MHKIAAFLRRDFLSATSYKTATILSLLSLITLVIPLFFVAQALQPVVGDAIASEGDQYFAFVIAGMAAFQFVNSAVGSIPSAIATGTRTGTLEAILSTPTRLPVILAGLMAYPFIWTFARAVILLVASYFLGATFNFENLLLAALLFAAITLAYIPFGIVTGALIIAFRTTASVPNGVLLVSMFLGGVYYPTRVIPAWLQDVSSVVPLTYGLRALRRVLIEDDPVVDVLPDLAILLALTALLLTGSFAALRLALRYARRSGTLAQY